MRSNEEGFVLVDALVSAVVVSLAGTAALTLGLTLMSRGDRLLDRSLLLTNLKSRAQEVFAVGADALNQLPKSADGSFNYIVTGGAGTADPDVGQFAPVRIQAQVLGSLTVREGIEIYVAPAGLFQ